MDETWIQFKGQNEFNKMSKNKGYWCWICIDTKTRFILNMHLALDKQMQSGDDFFENMKKFTELEPKIIASDGNPTYKTMTKKHYPRAKHLLLKMITLDHSTSFIERYNNTIKARTKVMRGFDEFEPCQNTLNLFMIYYNYLRPHMALEGKTPAQKAGISLELPERWTSLIRKALVDTN